MYNIAYISSILFTLIRISRSGNKTKSKKVQEEEILSIFHYVVGTATSPNRSYINLWFYLIVLNWRYHTIYIKYCCVVFFLKYWVKLHQHNKESFKYSQNISYHPLYIQVPIWARKISLPKVLSLSNYLNHLQIKWSGTFFEDYRALENYIIIYQALKHEQNMPTREKHEISLAANF